jgi:ABC-type amino acid transport substrate-binding protein
MKIRWIAILVFLFLFGCLVTAETVKIAIGEQPPLLTESGGIVNLVIEEALSRGGYEVSFDWLPIGRILKLLENDALDIYVTPSNTPGQQNAHIDFLAANGVFFYLTKNTPKKKISSLGDLAGKTVGTVTNSPLKPMFEKAGIIVDEGPFETMFLKLDNGRVDFVSTADVGGLLTIRKTFPGREAEFDFTDFSYTVIATGLYVKPGNEGDALLNCARKGFTSMKADGTLNRMLRDFFGPVYASRVTVY